ncbi:MAG: YbaB/EbfC family nucleoid-associated protein [Caulobacterales bacterium]|jgi:DNA-binding YbaB/EbfC family protein
MKDISQIMRQAQAMQAKIAEAQKKVELLEVEGSAGGGMVKVRLSGKHLMLGLTINPELLKPEEAEIVEDLVKAAYEDARRRLDDAQQDALKDATAGMGMMPGFKLPF